MAGSRANQFVESKPKYVQDEYRRILLEHKISDQDAIWALIEIIDMYGASLIQEHEKVATTIKKGEDLKQFLEGGLKKTVERMARDLREQNAQLLIRQHAKIETEHHATIEKATENASKVIEERFQALTENAEKKIRRQEFQAKQRIEKEIQRLFETARKNKAPPIQSALVFFIKTGMVSLALFVIASVFIGIGQRSATGEPMNAVMAFLANFFLS